MKQSWIGLINGLLTFIVLTFCGRNGLHISVPITLALLTFCVWYFELPAWRDRARTRAG